MEKADYKQIGDCGNLVFVKEYWDETKDFRYFTKTIHPALGEFRNRNKDKWQATAFNGKIRNKSNVINNKYTSIKLRLSYCHEYIGDCITGYDDLLLPINEMRLKKLNQIQLTLF
jgi:hypothetical protein